MTYMLTYVAMETEKTVPVVCHDATSLGEAEAYGLAIAGAMSIQYNMALQLSAVDTLPLDPYNFVRLALVKSKCYDHITIQAPPCAVQS